MPHYHHRPRLLRQRQDSALLPVSGSVVVSNPTPTASALVQNTAAVASGTQGGVPLVASSDDSNPASTTVVSDSSATANSSSSSSGQIPLSTAIGACVAASVVLIFAVLLALYCSKRQKSNQKRSPPSRHRNAANDVSRRRSHLEPWGRLPDDNEDRWEGNLPIRQRPSSSPIEKLATMFNRSPSTNSGEKSSEGPHVRESFGTLQPFEKYHPDLAAQMASQAAVAEADAEIMKPPPARTFMGHVESVSWDGETVRGDSFLSRGSRLSGNMSPTLMSKEKTTPAATESRLHRWESAEVLHTDLPGLADGRQNPFADNAAVPLTRVASNPFFNAREKPTKRTLLPNTTPNPFADSHSITAPTDSPSNLPPTANDRALQSLIAALEASPMEAEERRRIISMHSSIYSRGSYVASETGSDAVSVTAFPYPPAQIPRR